MTAAQTGQPMGLRRTALQQHDLSVAGREVVQDRVDFDPGFVSPKHAHPGEEIVYVIDGSLEYQVEGKPPVTLNAGDVLFIPAEASHSVKNVGHGSGAELATYFAEKGKPIPKAARNTNEISLPVGITVFPEDVYRPPETWARRA